MRSISKRWFAGAAALAVAAFTAAVVAPANADHHGQAKKAKVGEAAPDFTLTGLDGKSYTLADYTKKDKIVVLEWWNPGCPFVVKHHKTMTTMADLAKKYKGKDVVWMAINSTNPNHRDYGMDRDAVKDWKVKYPVLLDSDGVVGSQYGARTTPHMYIIDADGVLRYQGAIDSHSGRGKPSDPDDVVNYVDQALQEILRGETVSMPETRPYGCSVKYAS